MSDRLTRTDYRAILALVEADIHKTKAALNPPADADWGLTARERQEFTASLKQLQSIHKKLCYRAWPRPINHCDQESIRYLVDSPKPYPGGTLRQAPFENLRAQLRQAQDSTQEGPPKGRRLDTETES